MDDREVFENSHHYFLKALEVLALPAEVQCERMGYYNVAFEIKEDVSAGAYLSQSDGCCLSMEETAAITALIEALNAVPLEVVTFAESREISLNNMQHVSWAPLRKQANDLLLMLAPAKLKNQQYLESVGNEIAKGV